MFSKAFIRPATALILSVSLIPVGRTAPSQTPATIQIEQSVEQLLAPWMSDDAPGVAIGVSVGGKVIFSAGAGMADLDHGQPVLPDTVFQVASVSKQFTAFATLMLVSEGRIDLDDDIRTYIPELTETPRPVLIRHLLSHTGGLREQSTLLEMAGWLPDDIRTHDQVMAMIALQNGVNFEAGDEVEYSNTGYFLLSEIVSRVSGIPFETFTQDRIFAPLSMNQTSFRASRNSGIPGHATSYYQSDEGFKTIVSAGEVMGSTGLYTTATDLLKWTANFETRQVGDEAVFRMMAVRSVAADGSPAVFANGQELRPYKGLQTWSHGGRDAGYRSFVLRVPEKALSLSVLSNRTDFDTARMAFALVDAYLGSSPDYEDEEASDWKPASAPELDQYAGHYEIYPGVIFTLTPGHHGLNFGLFNGPAEEMQFLEQTGAARFLVSAETDTSIAFARPEHGDSKAQGFDYVIGLHGSIPARRIELNFSDPVRVSLAEYVGSYYSPELRVLYELRDDGGQLIVNGPRRPEFGITPYQKDIFSGAGPLQKLEFIRDDQGEVSGVLASGPLAVDVSFTRVRW